MSTTKQKYSGYINGLLSLELQVEPLKEGQTAIFRLSRAYGAGEIDLSISDDIMEGDSRLIGRGKPVFSQGMSLSAKHRIHDKYANNNNGKDVLMVHSEGFRTIGQGKEMYEVPIEKRVIFDDKNEILITHEMHETYCFLMRHNGNGSNPYRDSKKSIKFYQVREEATISPLTRMEKISMANSILKNYKTPEQILILAQNLNTYDGLTKKIDLNSTPEIIQSTIYNLALDNPDLIIKLDIGVDDAIEYRVDFWIEKGLIDIQKDKNRIMLNRFGTGRKKLLEFETGTTDEELRRLIKDHISEAEDKEDLLDFLDADIRQKIHL